MADILLTRPSITLLISTYNWVDALEKVFEGVLKQTVLPDEIVIADDGSRDDTKNYIDSMRIQFPMPIRHVWHEDKGFRRTVILNKALSTSTCEYIIQIDGDVIPERHFIQDHIEVIKRGHFVCGSRALLQPDGTVRPSHYVNLLRCHWLRYLFASYKHKFSVRHVRGCNLAFWRTDFMEVNGYNEDIIGWGHEDRELIIRLINKGVKETRLKFGGVVRHIYHAHETPLLSNKQHNYDIECNAVSHNASYCNNGINKLGRNSSTTN